MNPSPKFYPWIAVVALAVAFFWSSFDAPVMDMDEGMLLAYPEQIGNGHLPYRDFETFYTPGNLLFLSGTYQLFGTTITVERTVGLLYRLAILSGILALLQGQGLRLAVGGAVIATITMKGTHVAAFAWWGGIACAIWSIALLTKPTGGRIKAAGFLAGMALLYRQDLGPAMICASLPVWLALSKRDRWWFIAFGGIALSPLAWITAVAGWQSVYANLVTYPVFLANPGRRLPLSSTGSVYQALFAILLVSVCANVVAAILNGRRTGWSVESRAHLGLSLLAGAVSHQVFQRCDITHLLFAITLSFAILPLSLVRLAPLLTESPSSHLREVVAVCVVGFLFVGLSLGSLRMRTAYLFAPNCVSLPLTIRERTVPIGGIHYILPLSRITSVLERESKPGERLFVGPGDLRCAFANDTYIYHLFPWLTPASYFMEMNPMSANRADSRLASDIETADWVILNRVWDLSREPNLSRQPGPETPNTVVQSKFTKRMEVGLFLLYERTDRRSSKIPATIPTGIASVQSTDVSDR